MSILIKNFIITQTSYNWACLPVIFSDEGVMTTLSKYIDCLTGGRNKLNKNATLTLPRETKFSWR